LARNEVGLVNETMILKEWLLYRLIIIVTLKLKKKYEGLQDSDDDLSHLE